MRSKSRTSHTTVCIERYFFFAGQPWAIAATQARQPTPPQDDGMGDAAMHYDFSTLGPQFKDYSFQLNATNPFDKTYVTLCQDNGCYYGLRRQVIATLRYRW